MRRLTADAPLRGSNGVAFGPDGRLYVAEFLAGRISAVDLAGGDVETIVAPDGPIQAPDDLAFGADGAMYVTDLVPGRVWRRAPDGVFTLVADGLRNPNGIACAGNRLFVNEMVPGGRLLELVSGGSRTLTGSLAMGNAMQLGPDGYLYYPHMLTGEVFRIGPDGGDPELVADRIAGPVAVRFDLDGTLLVLSRDAAGTITRIGSDSRTTINSGVVGMDNAAFDPDNRMFVSSYAGGGIAEVRADGTSREVVPRGLSGPRAVTVDLGGTVHVADHYRIATPVDGDVTTTELVTFVHGIAAEGNSLLHFTAQYGQIKTYERGSREIRSRAAGLQEPTDVEVRADGALVVTESAAGRVVAVGRDDAITILADGLGRPAGVAIDDEGRCYVTDEERGVLYRLDAENGEDGDDGKHREDGEHRERLAALVSGLDAPQGVAVVDDEVFVVESGRRRVIGIGRSDGRTREIATDLPVGPEPRPAPALFACGLPGVPRPFAGLAAAPDGTLYLSAGGEGTVLHLEVNRDSVSESAFTASFAIPENP